MEMYIRGKENGIILDYSDFLANHDLFEVVTEAQAFPERFAPVDLTKYKNKIDIEVPAEVVEPPVVTPELSAQKGKVFGTVGEVKVRPKSTTQAPVVDAMGLKGEF